MIRILFNVFANEDNPNAQSLNARDIAIRLSPDNFQSTFFLSHNKNADPRLRNRANIRFIKLPPRLGSLGIAYELLWGNQDILFYPELNDRASRIFWKLKSIGREKEILTNIEISLEQLRACPETAKQWYLHNIFRSGFCVAITPSISETFSDAYRIESRVIPVGVNMDIFTPVDRSGHNLPVRVLYVGSIQPRKQIHLILELAKLLKKEPVEFHIIGPVIRQPDYHQSLLKEKERERLDNVIFHDSMIQSEIYEWMKISDIFLLPSRLEGLPKVTLEAAATGLPCILFDDYQTPSVINGVTGFQVKTFNEMADKLSLLIENNGLRLRVGTAAVEHAKTFDWDIVVKQWEEVFEKVAADKH